MSQQNRTNTQPNIPNSQLPLETALRAIVTQASREKLLPKIMWKADKEFGSKKLINYQKLVRKQYENDLKAPLKYNPQEAMSDREKFREKVMKLVTNQLDVDYFQNVRLRDGTMVTYKGHEIEECKIPTKKEFQIFKNFNEKRFKETYANLFEDKLEIGYDKLYQSKTNKRCHTFHVLDLKPQIDLFHIKTQQSPKPRIRQIETHFEAPKTERKKEILLESGKKKAIVYFNDKKIVGSQLAYNEHESILSIVRQIGGYTNRFQQASLSLTRESINRWLKTLYEKSHRIIDFLEIKEVVTVDDFWQISKRLRVMPLDHVLFMTFLYYDGNNDGYICDYDLERLNNLRLTRSVLTHDYHKIKQSNFKKVLSKREAYIDLYKLNEVTETIYFQWKKKRHEQNKPEGFELQMKNRLLSSRQKQIFLDFSSFSSIYKFDKPFLWYDLMYLFSGVRYQGLRYD